MEGIMNDIVERLHLGWSVHHEAADEILLLRQQLAEAQQEPPPLWRHAVTECNEAHVALDTAGAPKIITMRRVRGPDGDEDVTVGLAARIKSLAKKLAEAHQSALDWKSTWEKTQDKLTEAQRERDEAKDAMLTLWGEKNEHERNRHHYEIENTSLRAQLADLRDDLEESHKAQDAAERELLEAQRMHTEAQAENEKFRIACASGWGEPVLVQTLREELSRERAAHDSLKEGAKKIDRYFADAVGERDEAVSLLREVRPVLCEALEIEGGTVAYGSIVEMLARLDAAMPTQLSYPGRAPHLDAEGHGNG